MQFKISSRRESRYNIFILLAYANVAASRTLLQRLLVCLNFTLYSEDFSVGTNEKSDFYELL